MVLLIRRLLEHESLSRIQHHAVRFLDPKGSREAAAPARGIERIERLIDLLEISYSPRHQLTLH